MRLTALVFGVAGCLAAGTARAQWLPETDSATLPLFLLGLCVTLMLFRVQYLVKRKK